MVVGTKWLESILQDLRHVARSCCRRPAVPLAAILCFALGTGPNVVIMALANATVLRPLPFPDAQQLVTVSVTSTRGGGPRPFTTGEYESLVEQVTGFADVAARSFMPLVLGRTRAGDEARVVQSEVVSDNYFGMLSVPLLLGRDFGTEAGGAPPASAAIIGHRLWRQHFDSDPSILERTIRLNNRVFDIVGVAPPDFVGATRTVAASLWLPIGARESLRASPAVAAPDDRPWLGVMARLRRGVSLGEAQAELDTRARSVFETTGGTETETNGLRVARANGLGVPVMSRPGVLSQFALVVALGVIVLIVAAANVVSLLMMRAAGRRMEMDIRLALGAGRSRILQHFLAESVPLSLLGGLAGILLIHWLTPLLVAAVVRQPAHIVPLMDFRPDWRVVMLSLALALLAGIACGIASAMSFGGRRLGASLRRGSGGAGGADRRTSRMLDGLVALQLAASTVLLVLAGSMVRDYVRTVDAGVGLATGNMLLASEYGVRQKHDAGQSRRLYSELLDGVDAIPGVVGSALTSLAPLGRPTSLVTVRSVETGGSDPVSVSAAVEVVASARFFEVVGAALTQGRGFLDGDVEGAERVAIVNDSAARRLWPGEDAVGQRFTSEDSDDPLTVIGVADDIKYGSLTQENVPAFYRPVAQADLGNAVLLVRTAGEPMPVLPAIEDHIGRLDSDVAIVDALTFEEQAAWAIEPSRQMARSYATLCLLALVIAGIGLFALLSYGVRLRRREFGIRSALGASRRHIVQVVVLRGLVLACLGGCLGAGASALVVAVVNRAGLLSRVIEVDALTLGACSTVLLAIVLGAAYWPSVWAATVPPQEALKEG